MREFSQQKGKYFQSNAKAWISNIPLLGCRTKSYGDAYDITNKATEIGGIYFDFSLKLVKKGQVKGITYAECKYRDEANGNVNIEFKQFIKNVYSALINTNSNEVKSSEFLFISNIPPDEWRHFVNNKLQFLENLLKTQFESLNQDIIHRMTDSIHIFVLSEKIISGA